MNWDKLDIHLENLIPGIVLLSIIVAKWTPDLNPFSGNQVALGTAFVATAYMLGAVTNIFSRVALDPVSAITFRTPMIKIFAKRKISDIDDRSMDALNSRYSFLIDQAMICGNDIVIKEVQKRRQTGRLCRSALVPAVLVIVVLLWKHINSWALSSIPLAYLIMLLLYGYSEVAVFTEAHRGYRIKTEGNEVHVA